MSAATSSHLPELSLSGPEPPDETRRLAPAPTVAPHSRRRAQAMPRLAPGPHLVVDDGADMVAVALGEGNTRIGRGFACDVELDDVSVSRRHAIVRVERGRVTIHDDRSLNGVFVNGDRVDMRELRGGDVVAIGRVRLRFVLVEP